MTKQPPESYLNRELSLLDFQERVLSLGERDDLPLLERVKFAAIVSQNLDEFFQARVAGLINLSSHGRFSGSRADGRCGLVRCWLPSAPRCSRSTTRSTSCSSMS